MNNKDFENLMSSIKEMGQIRKGKSKPSRQYELQPTEIKQLRARLKKSQSEFALMIGVSVATLQNWEQGRRQPEGPARALLKVVAAHPKLVAAALRS